MFTRPVLRYRFTEQARAAVAAAYQAAYDRHCDYLGTEHLLLGLIADPTDPIIALLLSSAGLACTDVRERVETITGHPADRPRPAHLPQSPNLRLVLRHGHEASLAVGHCDMDTTHLTCGLLATPSTAAKILTGCGLDLPRLHQHLHRQPIWPGGTSGLSREQPIPTGPPPDWLATVNSAGNHSPTWIITGRDHDVPAHSIDVRHTCANHIEPTPASESSSGPTEVSVDDARRHNSAQCHELTVAHQVTTPTSPVFIAFIYLRYS